jgi:hypothetical protein
MLTTMKNIFRMPPSPFQLGKYPSQPLTSNLIKARRSSGASVQETPSILRSNQSQEADHIKEVRESDVEDYGEANGLGQGVYDSNGNGMSSPLSEQSKPSSNSKEVVGKDDKQSSDRRTKPAAVQHTVKGDHQKANGSINAPFVYSAGSGVSQDQSAAVLTPPPSSHGRKRHLSDRADECGETTKKRSRSRESTVPHSEKKRSRSSSGKHRQKSRKSDLSLSPKISMESTLENEEHEKEEKRRLKRERKLERKRKRMERQTSETGSQRQLIVTNSLRDETFPDNDVENAEISSQSPVTIPDKSQIFEFDESPEPAPKSVAKKRKRQQREVPASVEPQSREDRGRDHELDIESSSLHHQLPQPEKKSSKKRKDNTNLDKSHDETQTQTPVPPEQPALEPVANLASQEIPEGHPNVKPSPRRRKSKSQEQQKYLSSERIIDSSGEEEADEETTPNRQKIQSPKKSRTPNIPTFQTKVVKAGKGPYSREECGVVNREVNRFQLVSRPLNINL